MQVPIIIFLILLITASVVFLAYVILWNKNAMASHMGEIRVEGLEGIKYPKTVNNLTQVFENIYFDTTNGNVLDISANEVSGNNISSYLLRNIYSRDRGNKVDATKYKVEGTDITSVAGTADTMSSTYDQFSVTIPNKKQVFYVPWDTATYIHVIDLERKISETATAPQNVMSFCYDRTNEGSSSKNNPHSESIISINTQAYTKNITDGRTTVIALYDTNKAIFKIVDNVYYDPTNGALITQTQSGINIYERKAQTVESGGCKTPTPAFIANSANQMTGTSVSIVDVGFCCWVVQLNDFLIVYMGNGRKTAISILNMQTNAKEYSFVSVVRFLPNGTLDAGNSLTSITTNPLSFTNNNYDTDIDFNMLSIYAGGGFGGAGGAGGADMPKNPLSDYYKWTDYWNKVSGTNLYDKIPSNEYILKSQIVPPVCPRCPSCPNSGVCTTCGGNGGSGTQVKDKKSKREEEEEEEEEEYEEEDDSLLEKAGSGTKDLLEDAGSGAKDLLYDTASGARRTAYDAASGAKGAVKDVYGEAKGVAKGVYGEAKGLAGGALSGVKGLFQSGPTQIQPISLGGAGGAGGGAYGSQPTATGRGMGIYANIPKTQGADFMTYFGALQPKGDANYIPVTADFSSFRK